MKKQVQVEFFLESFRKHLGDIEETLWGFYVKNHPFRSRQSTQQSFRPRKSTQETTRKKTHQAVEGKAPVLRIICKGLENGL